MKIKFVLAIIGLLSFSRVWGQQTINGSFVFGGKTRTYSFYVPASYQASQAVPLVLNLHGYTSNGSQQNLYTNFKAIADTAGFIVVHPDGTYDLSNNRFWNFGIFGASVNDLGFLEALIDTISNQYSINPNRVYSCGMSNGGYMSYYLACNSTRFAAVGSVTGSMSNEMYNTCSSQTPVIQIHGTTDPTVPYNGNATSKAIEDVVAFWVNQNQCNTQAIVTAVPDNNPSDGATADHYLYNNGVNGNTVEFFKVTNGGHTWPGGAVPLSSAGNTCMDFSASKEIWRFFSQHEKGTATIATTHEATVHVFPNPVKSQLNIVSEKPIQQLNVIDLQGRIIISTAIENKHSLSMEMIAPGVYWLEVITPTNIERVKISVE